MTGLVITFVGLRQFAPGRGHSQLTDIIHRTDLTNNIRSLILKRVQRALTFSQSTLEKAFSASYEAVRSHFVPFF